MECMSLLGVEEVLGAVLGAMPYKPQAR
jgi:hypothetical protein